MKESETPRGFKLTMKVEGAAARHFMELLSRHDPTGALDCLVLTGQGDAKGELENGHKFEGEANWELPAYVTFHPVSGGIGFMIADEPARWKGKPMEKFASEVAIRNREYSIPTPPELVERTALALPDAKSTTAIMMLTGQEIDILERSACDGKTGKYWSNLSQRDARIYEPKKGKARVELSLTDEDKANGLTMAAIDRLTKAQDADFAFTLLYGASVLAPPNPLPSDVTRVAWIDLDDVMEKIGWRPKKRSLAERAELRARMYDYLVYGDRAAVNSRRSQYFNKATGESIETQIESPIWRISSIERPLQCALFGEVPLRVELTLSKQWEPILLSPQLQQYFPMGELLSSIPANQVAGDLARVIGLTLANLWRRKPRETMYRKTGTDKDGNPKAVWTPTIRPTRREVLTRYTPKTKTIDDFLDPKNKDPRRFVEYWHDALDTLVKRGFLAAKGEPSRSVDEMLAAHGREGWREAWSDEAVLLAPGDQMQKHVQDRADALPPLQPKSLLGKRGKRRGRPRKPPTPEAD